MQGRAVGVGDHADAVDLAVAAIVLEQLRKHIHRFERGVELGAAAGVEIFEYSPAEVKSSVTGSGRADKTQVARMVGMLLSIEIGGLTADASDALACAICLARRYRMDRLESLTLGEKQR